MPKKKVSRQIKKIIHKLQVPFSDNDIKKLQKKYTMVDAGDILAYLMNRSNKLNVLMAEAEKKNKKIITTDSDLYEAISSARGSVEVPLDRLRKVLWNVIVVPKEKIQITRKRMNEIRRAYGGM